MSVKLAIGAIVVVILAGLMTSTPAFPVTSGILLGIVIGVSAGRMASFFQARPGLAKAAPESLRRRDTNANLLLKKEELDISKKRVQTGTVSVHKEVSTENKTIVVPVIREDLVIETKVCGTDHEKSKEQTIRIPLKNEQVEIVKHPVNLEEVSVYKRKLQGNQSISAALKREKLQVETKGEPKLKEIRKYKATTK